MSNVMEYRVNVCYCDGSSSVPFVTACKDNVEFYNKYGLSLASCRDGIGWFNRAHRAWEFVRVPTTSPYYGVASRFRFSRVFYANQYNLVTRRLYNLCKYVVNNYDRKSFNCKKFYRKYLYLSTLQSRYFKQYNDAYERVRSLAMVIDSERDYLVCNQMVDLLKRCQAKNIISEQVVDRVSSLLVATRYWYFRYKAECVDA